MAVIEVRYGPMLEQIGWWCGWKSRFIEFDPADPDPPSEKYEPVYTVATYSLRSPV